MQAENEKVLAAAVMEKSTAAFANYRRISSEQRATLLEKIASALGEASDCLIPIAMQESHLPEARLRGELSRTTSQLIMFAKLLREGSWVQASIDTALVQRKPQARPDIRKMLQPIGPVVVFGASNFPFAFSTMGGDTASALAAGCPVVIKAHPAHLETSKAVFEIAQSVLKRLKLSMDIIQHVESVTHSMGLHLVEAPATTAVGFTGSFQAGSALQKAAASREQPIAVFAEMSSTNPVVIFEDILKQQPTLLAQKLAGSVCLGAGQFCTNPGLILVPKSHGLDAFIEAFKDAIKATTPAEMLHEGIWEAYNNNLGIVLSQAGVDKLAETELGVVGSLGCPTIARVNADTFIHNKALQREVFGPFTLLVVAEDMAELLQLVKRLEGQLTTSLFATESDLERAAPFIEEGLARAGRIILNDVPTGVEVCASMVHGGPFPATTNAQYTSVGTTAILRWTRPVCYQGFPDNLLPSELQNANPLGIWRIVNDALNNHAI